MAHQGTAVGRTGVLKFSLAIVLKPKMDMVGRERELQDIRKNAGWGWVCGAFWEEAAQQGAW